MSTNSTDAAQVRMLNDQFRRNGIGHGSILLTVGVQSLGEAAVCRLLSAIRAFDHFSADNDPWEEHDFGAVVVDDQRVFWKIDYYDRSLEQGSPNPADPDVTHRALTIMLADEY